MSDIFEINDNAKIVNDPYIFQSFKKQPNPQVDSAAFSFKKDLSRSPSHEKEEKYDLSPTSKRLYQDENVYNKDPDILFSAHFGPSIPEPKSKKSNKNFSCIQEESLEPELSSFSGLCKKITIKKTKSNTKRETKKKILKTTEELELEKIKREVEEIKKLQRVNRINHEKSKEKFLKKKRVDETLDLSDVDLLSSRFKKITIKTKKTEPKPARNTYKRNPLSTSTTLNLNESSDSLISSSRVSMNKSFLSTSMGLGLSKKIPLSTPVMSIRQAFKDVKQVHSGVSKPKSKVKVEINKENGRRVNIISFDNICHKGTFTNKTSNINERSFYGMRKNRSFVSQPKWSGFN